MGKVLGKGQFGTTRIAIHKSSGEKYACKTISKRKLVKQQVGSCHMYSKGFHDLVMPEQDSDALCRTKMMFVKSLP